MCIRVFSSYSLREVTFGNVNKNNNIGNTLTTLNVIVKFAHEKERLTKIKMSPIHCTVEMVKCARVCEYNVEKKNCENVELFMSCMYWRQESNFLLKSISGNNT